MPPCRLFPGGVRSDPNINHRDTKAQRILRQFAFDPILLRVSVPRWWIQGDSPLFIIG
jgi:hypothetical protein